MHTSTGAQCTVNIGSKYQLPAQNPHLQQKREDKDGPAEAKAEIAGLETPAARDAMGALADALDFAARENTRLEVLDSANFGTTFDPAV